MPDEDDITDEIEGLEDDEADGPSEDDDLEAPVEEGDVEADDAEADAALEEDEETDQASLEELLAQRAAARRGTDEADDSEDILSLSSEAVDPPLGDPVLPTKADPLKDRQEFVCSNCYLVKPRVQLADASRMLCRDCV